MQNPARYLLLLAAWFPTAALAWDPYPDYGNPPPEARTTVYRPAAVTPLRAPAPAPKLIMAPVPASMPVAAPMPSFNAAPVPAYVPPPASVPAAPPGRMDYAPQPPPPPPPPPQVSQAAYAAPVPAQQSGYDYQEPSQRSTTEWTMGLEVFHDQYKEPDIDVETNAIYGAVTGGFDYYDRGMAGFYTGLDLRASWGDSEYSSGSGELASVPEQEYEARWKAGWSYIENGKGILPYSGLGMRYYRDDLKGETTSLGAEGYDRNIFQLYMPFGLRYDAEFADWEVRSIFELDALLWGSVSSRLGTIPGYENAVTHQDPFSGGGIRAEMMFGRKMGAGTFQFGPFLRYWDIGDSGTDSQPAGTFLEPQNERMQLGVDMKYRF